MKKVRLLTLPIVIAIAMVACGGEETPTPTIAPTAEPVEEPLAEPTEVPTETPAEEPSSATESAASADPLVGTIWTLTELNGQPPLPFTLITAEFLDNGLVTGSSGCNNYTATYEVAGDGITIDLSVGVATRKACPEPIMAQESEYLAALGAVETHEVAQDSLILYDAGRNAVAAFEAESQDLAGTSWKVTSYNNGRGGVVSASSQTELTANFGEDGQLTGNAGCNDYFGPYEADGGNLALGPLGTTRKLCPDEIMEQEAAYLAALETAAAYRIDRLTMNIRTADGATAVIMQRALSEQSADPLVGTVWNLNTLNGSDLVPNTSITAEFFEEGLVAGFSGCNNYSAAYEVAGNNITFNMSPVATTLKACPEPIMDQESQYLATLASTTTFETTEDELALSDAGGNPVAVYAAVNQDLTGTAWQVISYNNGTGGVVSVINETQITANFAEDGQLAGNASCNDYFGPYETEDNNISMGPFGTTRKLCPDPVMDQEGQYLVALESAATYKFDGMTLNVRTADGATAVNMRPVSTVSGLVTNVDDAPIPEGAILTVQIQDTSLQDVAATVIGEQIIENPGRFPIAYEVGFNPNDITSPQYTMSARLSAADGSLLFINDTAIPVITNGLTEDVEIPVIQVAG